MRLPIERLNRLSADHSSIAAAHPVHLDTPVDATRLFVCPTLTPLYYTKSYTKLSREQALRYNQLMGMLHNEVIAFFETRFAGNVLGALGRVSGKGDGDCVELARCLESFVREEASHTAMFRRLNRVSAPQWYADRDEYILRIPPAASRTLDFLPRRPLRFPMVLWVMLIMEERSLEISRRYAHMDKERVEPHYAAVYRAHGHDEVRHVQIDWHLLERFYEGRGETLRELNAALLRAFVFGFFLTPHRSTVRVMDLLVEEFPELTRLRPEMVRELKGLRHDDEYRHMMYSQEVQPLTYALFDYFPEFEAMRRAMTQPAALAEEVEVAP
jgi:hypothetical protein